MQGVSSTTFADSKVSKIVVNPTAGGDTVNVLSNTNRSPSPAAALTV